MLTPEKLAFAKKDMAILHPLPRVDEISVGVDSDPRACYFKQVANGKNMRKALILKLLTEAEHGIKGEKKKYVESKPCTNQRCISKTERGLVNMAVETDDGLRCAYCESGIEK